MLKAPGHVDLEIQDSGQAIRRLSSELLCSHKKILALSPSVGLIASA